MHFLNWKFWGKVSLLFLHHTENMANAQVRLDFVKNQRGGMSLDIDGHTFVIKSRREERVYWTCSNRACPSRVTTREGILVRHNAIHEPDSFHIETDNVMQKIRKRCRKETTTIPTIYKEEVSALRNRDWNEQSVELVKRIKTFEGCKSQLSWRRVVRSTHWHCYFRASCSSWNIHRLCNWELDWERQTDLESLQYPWSKDDKQCRRLA